MKAPASSAAASCGEGGGGEEGERKKINSELWYACAGPLVSLPPAGSLVVYFPQGHSEQVAASMQKDVDGHIPNYPNLPSKLMCLLHNVTMHADTETDEVYAQMTLQPVSSYDKAASLASELVSKQTRPQTEFFCKTLTASDTSTHGGFSVPRRAAERIFPALDFSMQPPAQELQARDLHDNVWTFRHIYRGQPKRHLLTTGWSLFVSGKRLVAGDSVLFIRDAKQQLLLGIRRANRQPTNLSSSVLSSDSMHIGILAAAAHAAANHSPFTVFYNPRASPSEFVIPFSKYQKAVYGNQISLGMRFRMMFETEESGTRRYMGTITGISDLDPVRWKNSQWRNLQVGWDEAAPSERRNRVSLWEIEPVIAPFFICPSPFFRPKRPRQPGMPDDEASEMENLFKRALPWLGEEICIKDPQTQSTIMPGLSLVQWMNMQQSSTLASTVMQSEFLNSLVGKPVQNLAAADLSRQLSLQSQIMQQNNIQFNASMLPPQTQPTAQLSKSVLLNQSGTVVGPQKLVQDSNCPQRQQAVSQSFQDSQPKMDLVQPQVMVQAQLQQQQQQPLIQNLNTLQATLQQIQLMQQQQPMQQQQQQQLQLQQQQPQLQVQQQQQHIQLERQQQQQQQPQLQVQQQQQQLQLEHQQQQQHQLQQQQQMLQHQQQAQHTQQQMKIPGQPSQLPGEANMHMQSSDHQIKLQLLQSVQQQQQQSLLAPTVAPKSQLPLMREQQKILSILPQQSVKSQSITEHQTTPQQFTEGTPQAIVLSNTLQYQSQQKPEPQQGLVPDLHWTALPATTSNVTTLIAGTSLHAAGGTQSLQTDDAPSCSTSHSMHDSAGLAQTILNTAKNPSLIATAKTSPSATILTPSSLEANRAVAAMDKELNPYQNMKQTMPITKMNDQKAASGQACINNMPQMDYLDTSSSATSVCLSQNDGSLQQSFPLSSFNHQQLLRDAVPDSEFEDTDPRNNLLFGVNIDGPLGSPLNADALFANNIDMEKYANQMPVNGIANHVSSKDSQQELSSSMVSQSFGVPDIAFNSIDSALNENSLLNRNSWAPAPPLQRMRTYTKVHKRGAVGRSVDITRYSGYDELKRDIARMFGIEGQLGDQHRVGWKLVYEDHEKDVLLIGDDPWEEFVNCVRCIRILSPQEEMQMRLVGDLGDSILTNQACSSSDGGHAWRGPCDKNSGNRSVGSYDQFG